MAIVMEYATGQRLDGTASPELVRESVNAEPTGAVPAWRDDNDEWQYCPPSGVDLQRRRGFDVRTVYVET